MGCTKSAVRWTTNNSSVLSSQLLQSRFYWTLSFSGAGHLLPYHLGVANTLLLSEKDEDTNKNEKEKIRQQQKKQQFRLPIKSIVGSSSGAIAATVSTILPHRLDDYTDRFLQDRGYAFKNLREMLLEEEEDPAPKKEETVDEEIMPLLSICTTRCSDGGIELFSFGGDGHNDVCNSFKEPNQEEGEEPQRYARLLKAIEASCRIPRSFHPFDMFVSPNNLLLQRITSSIGGAFNNNNDNNNKNCHQHYYYYPDEDGIEIDGQFYVDGGIAAPFPNTPYDFDDSITGRIVVSPIAGDYYDRYNKSTDNKQSSSSTSPSQLRVISPRDESWALPSLLASLTISGCSSSSSNIIIDSRQPNRSTVAVRARPSIQNLRAMVTAIGVVPATTIKGNNDVLRDWYERGKEDAYEFVLQHQNQNKST
ncbi:hypothetical protein FRACYDRAFT_247727 [Fragilariopsis cylindrus CCMP1102]|uniref:PNPLA domain-containing protein n=1 Tax=Fragilariopsis cylindrus CCMP1102 TaxID=635003 RepID=A0A1E7EX68_9STRA|nr:hypothetical protein FRACYDRAFT_247727 [Fragilariopsis cylindrus CCMP1102]|eukprot:OEU10113.1 hypothetical protein FRACYDRAFT_247727 [Fragilariopsis cylindrus CCMP1102]